MRNTTKPQRTLNPNTPQRIYVGADLDPELVNKVQAVADRDARGNRSIIVERYIKAGLERDAISHVSGCKTPAENRSIVTL